MLLRGGRSEGRGRLRAVRRARTRLVPAGRWALLRAETHPGDVDPMQAARLLLRRWGVVVREVLARETRMPPWRVVLGALRTLEARGEIRGGRFVAGFGGEQFALPEAVAELREVRRTPPDRALVVISAADPLNLAGIVTPGERVRVIASNRIVFRDGVALAAMEGDYIRPLSEIDPAEAGLVANALAGRPVPSVLSGYVGRTG
jgi:ATP-dependent Lhr-like helicase